MDYRTILDTVAENYRNILRENLVGIYVHGSIAFGCFHWDKSDIDFIVAVHEKLSHAQKRTLMDFTMKIDELAPPKGLEMSVVLKKHCWRFVYPTPFELHFSHRHQDWYRRDPDDYCEKMQGEDRDLAAHFTVVKYTGITWCGEPIGSVFGDIPAECYWDSILRDIRNAKKDIAENPVYTVLNLCRVAAYRQRGLILSKEQGGVWAIENADRRYSGLIHRALRSYRTDEKMTLCQAEADPFCDSMFHLIF